MFLLVNNFKMIGMLLNVVHVHIQKKLTKTYYKGFPAILLQLTMSRDSIKLFIQLVSLIDVKRCEGVT